MLATTAAATVLIALSAGCGGEAALPRPTASQPAATQTAAASIAGYLRAAGIVATAVRRDDPGTPALTLPVPDGWLPAGDRTPQWAYDAILHSEQDATQSPPSVVALMSRLSGAIDTDAILRLAGGELHKLPGYQPVDDGNALSVAGHPAYRLCGTWIRAAQSTAVCQTTVVLTGPDSVYLVQLNANGPQTRGDVVRAGAQAVDQGLAIDL